MKNHYLKLLFVSLFLFLGGWASAQLTPACSPSYPSGTSSWYTSSFSIGSFTHTQTNGNTHDFTVQSFNVNAGSAYSITATTQGYVAVGVAADFNNDGDFADAGELFPNPTYIATAPATYNFSITIPSNVVSGSYRFRVFSIDGNAGGGTPAGSACGTYGYGSWADYTVIVSGSTGCQSPVNVVSSAVLSTSATISWSAPPTAPAMGYEYYLSTSNTSPTAATVATGSVGAGVLTKNLTSLTSATPYYVWVRSVCTALDKSNWSYATFTTPCATFTAPFTEAFSNGALPNCWTSTTDVGQTAANAFWKFGSGVGYNAANNGRTAGTYAWVDASTPNTGVHTVTLTTPPISLVGLTTGYVEFDYFKNNNNAATAPLSNNKLTVEINSGSGWTVLWSDTSNSSIWRTIGLPLAASYANATIQLRFVVDKDAYAAANFYDDLLLDNVKVSEAPLTCTGTPSAGTVPATMAVCAGAPINLVATGVTTNTLGLTGQWQYRTPAGSGAWVNLVGATAATYTVPSAPATPTDYRYTLTCGTNTGNSNTMTTTINAANTCYCVPSGNNATYLIDTFSTTMGSTNITNNGSGYSTNGYGNFTTQTVTQNIGSSVGFHAVYGTGFNTFGTKIWVDWNQDGVFADPAEVVYSTTSYSGSENGNITVPATALTGTTRMRIGISYTPSTGPATPCATGINGEFEDYTFVVTAPSCAVPSALVASNVNSSSATISWSAASPAPANGYEYYQSTSSTSPTAATVATGAVAAGILTKNITALTPNTTYYFWVRSACSASNKSDWTLPVSFATPCLPTTVPYTAPLAAVTPPAVPNCMSTQFVSGGTGSWTTELSPGSGFTGNTLTSSTSSTQCNLWVYTQGLTLTAGTSYRVKYDYGNSYNFYTEKLKVKYGMGSTEASMTTQLADHPMINSATKATNYVDFVPTTTGVYYVGFQSYSDAYQDQIYLSNISVTLSPAACAGMPNADPIVVVDTICAGVAFDLVGPTWTTIGLNYQWQKSAAGANVWSNIVGATTETYNVAAGILAATDFRLIATCTNSSLSDTSNVQSVGLYPGNQCYCTPIYTTACSFGDNIKDVILAGNVAPGINNLNTPCPTNGYQDYSTTMSATLTAGSTYTGNVTTGYTSPQENVRIWIDYNQNGLFEASETIDTLQNMSNTSIGAISFTVPAATAAGNYRMRVRLAYATAPDLIDPCASITYGEAHDYKIIIQSGTTCTNPVVNLGADTTICAGQTLTLNAGAANATFTKLWSNAATTQTINVTTAGTYSVTVTDGTCVGKDTIVVGVTPLPVVNLGADTAICAGSTLTLSAGAANATYTKLWSNLATTQTIPVTTAGTYSVKVTNGACSKSDTIVVTVNPLPVVNLGADTGICTGSTLTLDAGNAGATYLWSDASTAQTLAVTAAGTYGVTVTKNGCSATDSIAVTATAPPTVGGITATGTAPNFVFTANGATNVTTYAWTFGDGGTSGATAPQHDYVQTNVDQTFTVTLIVSNACGSDTVTTTVVVPKSTGVNNLQLNAKELKLYPNPAQQLVTVENDSKLKMKQIKITNILGQEVARIAVTNQAKQTINVANLAAGIYNVTIEFEEGTVNRKLEILK